MEPTEGGRRAGISERGVKDHLGHTGFGAVGEPIGLDIALVQVVGRARAAAALVVVVERQRRVLGSIACLGINVSCCTQGTKQARYQSERFQDNVLFHSDS